MSSMQRPPEESTVRALSTLGRWLRDNFYNKDWPNSLSVMLLRTRIEDEPIDGLEMIGNHRASAALADAYRPEGLPIR